jgi:glyoxylase-like metal-dependent hydrolase (beta-lactamase superfamily II)
MAAPTPPTAQQLAGDLWILDTLYQGEPGVIASYLLTGRHGLALVDVGSAATVDQLVAGIRATGHAPEEIEHLVITHVHLDHAGACGRLVALCPRARVYVHRVGAPHLIDPSKLLASAERIYGDQMEKLWGRIEPTPAERVVTIEDGAMLTVGDRTLHALYTPGHAVHHVAYYDADRGEVFSGDLAGVRLQGIDHVRPPTPPPDLSLEDWAASIDRVLALDPQRLYLAHFGPYMDVALHLGELRTRLDVWGEAALEGLRAGESDAQIADRFQQLERDELLSAAAGVDAETLRRYELAANYLMSAQGYMRYYRKHHPELLTAEGSA